MDQAIVLKYKQLKGQNAGNNEHVSEIFHYEPVAADERTKRGSLFVIIEATLATNGELDLAELAKKVYSNIQDTYYHDEGGALEVLEQSVRTSGEYANTLSQNKVHVKIAAISIWGKALLYANQQLLPIGLRRAHEFIEFDHPPIGTENIKDGDLLIISEPNFFTSKIQMALREQQELDNEEFVSFFEQETPLDTNQTQKDVALFTHIEISKVPGDEEIIEIHYPEEFHKKDNLTKKLISKTVELVTKQVKKLIPKKLAKPTIYIKKKQPPKKKRLIALSGIAFLLVSSVAITYIQKQKKEQVNQYDSVITKANQDLTRAKQLATLNPHESLSIIDSKEKELGQVAGIRDEKAQDIATLEKTIKEIRSTIYKEKEVTLIKEDAPIEVTDNTLQIIDGKVVGAHPIDLDTNGWKAPISATTYIGNIYVLDPEANQIWKYIKNNTNYIGPYNYIQDGSQIKDSIDLAIDGGIYVLYPNKIDYFMVGKRGALALKGVFPPFGKNAHITTANEHKYIYVSSNSGIIVFDKEGRYKALYKGAHLNNIQKLYLNEDGTTLWLYSDGSWWKLNLAQG